MVYAHTQLHSSIEVGSLPSLPDQRQDSGVVQFSMLVQGSSSASCGKGAIDKGKEVDLLEWGR